MQLHGDAVLDHTPRQPGCNNVGILFLHLPVLCERKVTAANKLINVIATSGNGDDTHPKQLLARKSLGRSPAPQVSRGPKRSTRRIAACGHSSFRKGRTLPSRDC